LPGGRIRQQRTHEGPFVPQHTAALVADAVGVDEFRIGAKQSAVFLIGREAGKLNKASARSLAPSAGRK
jgi:hypothetical protein